MRTIYVVALYVGIELHVEFQKNLAAFETKEGAEAFVLTEKPRLMRMIELHEVNDAHMEEWEQSNPSPPYPGPGVEDYIGHTKYNEHNAKWNAEQARHAKEIGLDLVMSARLYSSHIKLEITEVPFHDER